ncbi:MAG: protein phosphatase 2C domain-containing protein [Ktedonobacteraceae bacterium]
MICPSCDTPNRDDAKFCKKCGHSFRTEAAKIPEAAQVSQNSTSTQENAATAEDISLAPTQIISQEQMLAYHAMRWRQDVEKGPPATPPTQQATEGEQAGHNQSDMPTLISSSSQVQSEQVQDQAKADTPRIDTNNANEAEAIPIPPPPPTSEGEEQTPIPPPPPHVVEAIVPPASAPEEALPGGTEEPVAGSPEDRPVPTTPDPVADVPAANLSSPSADEVATTTPEQEEEQGATSMPAEEPGTEGTTGDFPVLTVGTQLNERYEITQVVSEAAEEHIYEVIDHQGYQHCWNCGSEQNREGDEFCIDCGAEMLNATYTMHEYPATGDTHADASVIHGSITNTFVEHGHTYVIEQTHEAENAFPNGVHLIAAADSDAGDVRRSEPNEDSTLVLMLQRVHESYAMPAGVFIVADGLGGHDNGQVASRLAINTIAERMVRELLGTPLSSEKAGQASARTDEDTLVSLLQSTIEDANAAICQVNQRDKTDMGSTITGFMIEGDYAYILNVGDSRTYMVRGEQIYQLTNDHSLVGQLVAGGLIQPDDVYTHPQRSQIFRSLGDKLNVQIDIFKQQLHPGDILLSCSDGLWEMVRNPQIESILNNAPDPQMACTQLLEAANANGGEDNVSAVVVFVR